MRLQAAPTPRPPLPQDCILPSPPVSHLPPTGSLPLNKAVSCHQASVSSEEGGGHRLQGLPLVHISQGLREQILELGWKIGGGDRSRVSQERQPSRRLDSSLAGVGLAASPRWQHLPGPVRPWKCGPMSSIQQSESGQSESVPGPVSRGMGQSHQSSLVPGGASWARPSPEWQLPCS